MIERARGSGFSFLLLALATVASAASSMPAHTCHDPCLQAARTSRKECTSSASGAFTDAIDGCVAGAPDCVAACRFDRQECRDATNLGADIAGCAVDLGATKERCRGRFPPGSRPRVLCIDRAEAAASRCRNEARRRFRSALRDCRSAFLGCVNGCAPGGPAGGVDTCRSDGKSAFRDTVAGCKLTFQVTASGCVNKDVACVQECSDAREACNAPTNATLGAAIQTCAAQGTMDVATCAAANPGGGSALDQCTTTAKANAAACSDAALAAAKPGLATCAEQYIGCVRACPKP